VHVSRRLSASASRAQCNPCEAHCVNTVVPNYPAIIAFLEHDPLPQGETFPERLKAARQALIGMRHAW
jgi:hypothetical protein